MKISINVIAEWILFVDERPSQPTETAPENRSNTLVAYWHKNHSNNEESKKEKVNERMRHNKTLLVKVASLDQVYLGLESILDIRKETKVIRVIGEDSWVRKHVPSKHKVHYHSNAD